MIIAFFINLAFILNSGSVSTPVSIVSKVPQIVREDIPKRIIVKSVNIDLPVIESPFEGGSWIASEHFASYAQGTSPLNSDNGNTLIFAHARSKLFKPLLKAKVGDLVSVYSDSQIYYYKIVDREIVSPYNVEAIESPAKYKITLLTCVGANDENRLLLRGELIGLNENKYKEVI